MTSFFTGAGMALTEAYYEGGLNLLFFNYAIYTSNGSSDV